MEKPAHMLRRRRNRKRFRTCHVHMWKRRMQLTTFLSSLSPSLLVTFIFQTNKWLIGNWSLKASQGIWQIRPEIAAIVNNIFKLFSCSNRDVTFLSTRFVSLFSSSSLHAPLSIMTSRFQVTWLSFEEGEAGGVAYRSKSRDWLHFDWFTNNDVKAVTWSRLQWFLGESV